MMIALGVWADPYTVGQSVSSLELEDQHGNHTTLTAMPKTLIMAYEKGTGATVNEYLNAQDKEYLNKYNAVFIADISQMPGLVTKLFALPKMRKYIHTVLLIQDEHQGLQFPSKEEKITVLKFQDNVLTQVTFITTADELKAAIEQ
jgi:hypothetical protein